MPSRNIGKELAQAKRAYLMAPAGYGKTHAIALAVKDAVESQGRQLVLTHTHAGVHSLNSKLTKLGVSRSAYRVETIAGWCLKYASAFKGISKLETITPSGDGWGAVYPAAFSCAKALAVQDVIRASYGGVFVDEYQDCTIDQHQVVLKLADLMPLRILGDPLQSIYDFAGTLVSLQSDLTDFDHLEPLNQPYRWTLAGAEGLGEWLDGVRRSLLHGEPVSLDDPVETIGSDYQELMNGCLNLIGTDGSVLVVHEHPAQAHSFAKKCKGRFPSMEEIECSALLEFAQSLDASNAVQRVQTLLSFLTDLASNLTNVRDKYSDALNRDGAIVPSRYRAEPAVAQALSIAAEGGGPNELRKALDSIMELDQVNVYRPELLGETKRCLRAMASGKYGSFYEAAFAIRERTRQLGRRLSRLSSSRILLVKGLEFDTVVVANAKQLTNIKLLYVALTRGARRLLVQSDTSILAQESITGRKPPRTTVRQASLFD